MEITKRKSTTYQMTTAAILTAIGILIPILSPVKIIIGPASFTLASHVSIFIAMFISPAVTVAVCIGTTIGFLLGSFPLPIVLRAATHIIFASIGAWWLEKHPATLENFKSAQIFSFLLGVVHAFCEVVVVAFFYFGGSLGETYYQNGFFSSVFLLVGIGGIIHSIVDFNIAYFIMKALSKQRQFRALFHQSTKS